MLALGLPSYPPNLQAGAQDGAIIAILAARPRAMHFGGRARAIFMRGRRGHIRHWRPGHFVYYYATRTAIARGHWRHTVAV